MANSTPEFEPLELANVGEGKLDGQFQEAVAQAYAIFEESEHGGRYETQADGTLQCKVAMEVTLVFDLESRALDIGSRVSKFTPPKRKTIFRNGFMRDGVVLVEKAVQAELPIAPVRNIKTGDGK